MIHASHRYIAHECTLGIQRKLGADIILAFDECTSPLHDEEYTRRSMERTHRWAVRSLQAFRGEEGPHPYPQALYGIVQGGAFESLRRESSRFIGGMEFDGFAIGGNLGKTHADMYNVIEWTVPYLPEHQPRHLLGIGDVPSVFEPVERGCDTFDCVSPTRNARNGGALVRTIDGVPAMIFRLILRNARFENDPSPTEEECACYTCRNCSRTYLRHLFKAGESLGPQLTSIHNLHFMARLCAEIRAAMREDTFAQLKAQWLAKEEGATAGAV